jgi:uridine phosphorylase
VLAFTPFDLEFLVHSLDQHQHYPGKIYLTETYTGSSGDVSIAVTGPMIGAPQAVLVVEKLIALGVRRLIALGWCGSLQPLVRIGDAVLPTAAISDEGTSRHYPLHCDQPGPSPDLVGSLREVLRDDPIAVHEGTVWSTDAPYRETVGRVLGLQEQGVLAVDMEVAALFTVARFRGVELAAILAVSDELHDLSWRHGFRDERFRQIRERLAKHTLSALCATTLRGSADTLDK